MPLQPGTRIGGYQISARIGAGGMGEVYRAHDLRLGRDVAIKVLSPNIAADADALMRFDREARALASLNHPNIGGILGVEDFAQQPALILELVEGETLHDRIGHGAIPVGEAIDYAKQICDALDVAHEAGIVHRDLKPGNIKITEDGRIKILDFGLAKAIAVASGESPDVNPANSPTITVHGTQHGVILGTAAYMSPEQARGKRIDKRTDIWAFGCVLFEMLTGKRAFNGETTSDVIAAIIERTPDLGLLPRSTPPHVHRVVERCLEKDPKRRARDIADVRVALDQRPMAVRTSSRPSWIGIAASIVVATILGGAAWYSAARRSSSPAVDPVEFTFAVSRTVNPVDSWAIASPDGRRLAFVSREANREPMIWIRSLESATPTALAGTEGVGGELFWSPDGRHLGFRADGKLKRVPVDGGPIQVICPLAIHIGATWGKDDVIVIAAANRDGLSRVSAGGGSLEPLTHLDTKSENSHRWPYFLPDGRHFVFTVRSDRGISNALRVGSIDSPETKTLVESQSNAVYAGGSLLYVKDGALLAHPFDPATLSLQGSAHAVAGPVMQNTSSAVATFSASSDGRVLAYVGGSRPPARLYWFDRAGKALSQVGAEGRFLDVVLSHDEKHAVFVTLDADQGARDIWTIDIASGALARVTNHPATDWAASWSPDDKEIVFASDRAGQSTIYRTVADGTGEPQLVYRGDIGVFPQEWLPDGRLLFLRDIVSADARLQAIRVGAASAPEAVATMSSIRMNATATSPDGRWIVYTTSSTPPEVMAIAPATGERVKLSSNGGMQGSWRRDGKEVFYATPQGDIMSIAVSPSGSFAAPVPMMHPCQGTTPPSEFAVAAALRSFDVTGDGQRVLAICEPANTPMNVTVALGWQARLR